MPPRRRRPEIMTLYRYYLAFQSTPPRRRRQQDDAVQTVTDISIHASKKEATTFVNKQIPTIIFQSTPPRRRRPLSVNPYSSCLFSFQSTPPRRRRRSLSSSFLGRFNFNPRLQEGGDSISCWDSSTAALISIHASKKEATASGNFLSFWWMISIHASKKEATATYCDTSTIMYISSLNNFFVRYF